FILIVSFSSSPASLPISTLSLHDALPIYDFIPLDDGRWGLVLADVSGKGTAAALLMSATRGMLRSLAEACCTPAEVLTKLNRLRSEEHTSELQSPDHLVCRLLLEKKNRAQ